jgi:hypothetical protein
MTANLDQEAKRQLARAGRHLALAQQYLGPEMRNASAPVRACWDELNHTAVALGSAGVVVDVEPERVAPATDSLEHLRRIEESRSEGQALLLALTNALAYAEALDKRRGNWVGDMADTEHGETPGTNYAEAIQELHLQLKMEVHGARGAGRE